MSLWAPEKLFYWHNPNHSAWLWRWRANNFGKRGSVPQRCPRVGCQLNGDQALGWVPCLKRHVRARGSTLWQHTLTRSKSSVNSCVLKHWGNPYNRRWKGLTRFAGRNKACVFCALILSWIVFQKTFKSLGKTFTSLGKSFSHGKTGKSWSHGKTGRTSLGKTGQTSLGKTVLDCNTRCARRNKACIFHKLVLSGYLSQIFQESWQNFHKSWQVLYLARLARQVLARLSWLSLKRIMDATTWIDWK